MAKKKTALDFTYTAGLDIGNGYVKGLIERSGDTTSTDVIDIPSAVSTLTRPNTVPDANDKAADITGGDFFNNVDITCNSPMVDDNYRRLVGTRSLSARGALDEFSIQGNRSKAQQQLSKVLTLSIIAAKATRDAVATLGKLPEPDTDGVITTHVTLAIALPIAEFNRHRHTYASAFTGDSTSPIKHMITVNNFETPVTVAIVFDTVKVIAEGASAQFAINAGGEKLMDAMLADVRSKGIALEGITSADVLAATNTIGIDIGEGTVNFPVFTDGKFNVDASRSLDSGYGTVLERSIDAMDDAGRAHSFTSRKQLAEYLNKKPSALKRNFYNSVAQFVDTESEFFVKAVAEAFGSVVADVGAVTEVAYVFGGGSGPLREYMHTALLDKAVELTSEDAFPVLYLDAAYSRKLNREGLMLAARTLAAK